MPDYVALAARNISHNDIYGMPVADFQAIPTELRVVVTRLTVQRRLRQYASRLPATTTFHDVYEELMR